MDNAMTHPTESTIAVAGAGLLGRLMAWQLLRDGHAVTLYDADDLEQPAAAAWTAAGMVAPLCETAVSERSVYEMGRFALAQWPRWLDALDAGSLWHHQGSLMVAHAQDMGELTQFRRDLAHVLGDEPPSSPSAC